MSDLHRIQSSTQNAVGHNVYGGRTSAVFAPTAIPSALPYQSAGLLGPGTTGRARSVQDEAFWEVPR
jgi:hypothetical protein